jgi:hypothetical protein
MLWSQRQQLSKQPPMMMKLTRPWRRQRQKIHKISLPTQQIPKDRTENQYTAIFLQVMLEIQVWTVFPLKARRLVGEDLLVQWRLRHMEGAQVMMSLRDLPLDDRLSMSWQIQKERKHALMTENRESKILSRTDLYCWTEFELVEKPRKSD